MANNNDNKVLNVPPLRFPEFSGEWKMCTIGELTTNCLLYTSPSPRDA